jgi:hypothetical protein
LNEVWPTVNERERVRRGKKGLGRLRADSGPQQGLGQAGAWALMCAAMHTQLALSPWVRRRGSVLVTAGCHEPCQSRQLVRHSDRISREISDYLMAHQ